MAKVIDITDKLQFDQNPRLIIKGKEYEVNADASSVLKIMGLLGDSKEVSPKDIVAMYEMIFPEKERKGIDKLNLQFTDFQQVVFSAINLIVGDAEPGEQ